MVDGRDLEKISIAGLAIAVAIKISIALGSLSQDQLSRSLSIHLISYGGGYAVEIDVWLLDLAIQQERCYRGAGWKEEEEGRTGKREDGKGREIV